MAYPVPLHHAVRGMNESDYAVTGAQARAALDAAKDRGLAGYSRINRIFTREQIHREISDWIEDTPDDHYVWPVFAYRVRQEFGVDGQRPGHRNRKRSVRKVERWPATEAAVE